MTKNASKVGHLTESSVKKTGIQIIYVHKALYL